MRTLSRRQVIGSSIGLAAGAVARPYIANAADNTSDAPTATRCRWAQTRSFRTDLIANNRTVSESGLTSPHRFGPA